MKADDEVAVTILDEKNVQFLKLNDGFEIARSFTVDRKCSKIAKFKDKLYLTHPDEGFVGIYNLDDELLSIIGRHKSGNYLLKDPEHINFRYDQSKVYIWDRNKDITVFDAHGNHV